MPNVNGRYVPDWHADAVKAKATDKPAKRETEDRPKRSKPKVETATVKAPKDAETADAVVTEED